MKSRHICPSCKVFLDFDRALLSTVKCPKCKYEGSIADYKEIAKDTVKEPAPETEPNTRVKKFFTSGALEMVHSDTPWLKSEKMVNLAPGINTIGRESPNSTASLQLPTTDTFMSKNHAIIDVIMKANKTYEHRLSDDKSKNGTFHNDKRLEANEVVILMPNDTIRLGHTCFKFLSEI